MATDTPVHVTSRVDMPTDPRMRPAPPYQPPPPPSATPVTMAAVPPAKAVEVHSQSRVKVQMKVKVQEKLVKEETKQGDEATTSAFPEGDKASPFPSTPATSIQSNVTTPTSSVELATPVRGMLVGGTPVVKATQEEEEEEEAMDDLDEETPMKFPAKLSRSSLKKQWNTRSRKRRAPFDEGYSVESTDTEDDVISSQTASGVSSPAYSQGIELDADSVQTHKQWKKAIFIVWRHAAQHKYANLFLHPVREEDAPGYKNVVLRPMDLSTVKKKIETGLIKTDIEFQRDMLLMFQNAFMYNSSEHEVHNMAQEMKSDVIENIQDYLTTQAQLQLMEDSTPSKILRSREGRLKEVYEEAVFSPAKKRRTRADD